MAVLAENRFGVKLHAIYRKAFVADPHDFAIVAAGGNLQTVGHGIMIYDQRVVARNGVRRRQPGENVGAAMSNGRGLAVHLFSGADDLRAESGPYRLVTQADTKNRHLAGVSTDKFHRDA